VSDTRLRIAVFIDFDNIEIGVKNTLGGSFDAGLVLEALKERGEVVSKTAYSDWQRATGYSKQLTQHAIRMVQRNMTPGGDKNGADINLALDALEMAFTHPHINAFVIVGGDSDFISLVEKLKQYDKKVFVVGGKQFTSAIMQRNCHEFIAYENLIGSVRRQTGGRGQQVERASLDQVIPLVTRALKVISEREVSPQMGLLKSTLVQLDSTFSERSYGAGSFRDFVDKLEKIGVVKLHHGGKGGVLVELADDARGSDASAGAVSTTNGDGAETDTAGVQPQQQVDHHERQPASHERQPRQHGQPDHRRAQHGRRHEPLPSVPGAPPVDAQSPAPAVTGTQADGVRDFRQILTTATIARWPMYLRNVKQMIRQTHASFDERAYGFTNLVELLRAAQKDGLVRVERDRQGVLRVFQGSTVVAQPQDRDAQPMAPMAATPDVAVEPNFNTEDGSPLPTPSRVEDHHQPVASVSSPAEAPAKPSRRRASRPPKAAKPATAAKRPRPRKKS
jgi:uncharacterized LabA/DUF88 family protein